MKQYRTVNNLVGWITFLIAATVYCMTIEPTASFWDCPEFITTGYKLEVGHPPGAPFFMLVANLFSQFASDPSTVAKMVNYMSALMSGACVRSCPARPDPADPWRTAHSPKRCRPRSGSAPVRCIFPASGQP